MRTKMTYENSENKMFCKPPLLKQFKKENENKLISEVKNIRNGFSEYGMMQRIEDKIGKVETRKEQEDVSPTTSREFTDGETWRSGPWSTVSNSSTMAENTTSYHRTRLIGPQLPLTRDIWLGKPFAWLSANYKASNVSIDSIGGSSDSTTVETNPHNTVVIDFESSADLFECNKTIR